ncbi:MAG: folylpolyglutamate synthase/dihydrofolate synthase family protein [Deltaproteobacteria bacterium]|nr:folylpolyglutamate synthase/dihydrofolate synthase family protein [Deltaproteobacteria bacterium]
MTARYEALLARLYAMAPSGIVLGLDRVVESLAYFNNPQQNFRIAHIAGTNGKGSTSAFVAAGLRAQGRRVGLYTSPHLHRFVERVRVQGEPVSEAELATHLARIFDAIDLQKIPSLTLFEVATLSAWLTFEALDVQDVVLEVGLGGRLDATNVCMPAVCAITRIAMDHQAWLGDSLDAIAREKAGILKNRVPYVLGPSLSESHEEAPSARAAIDQVARSVGALARPTPTSVTHAMVHGAADVSIDLGEETLRTTLSLVGAHQIENACTAAGILHILGVSSRAIAEGLATAQWGARCELIANVLLDAAHNPDGIEALLGVLETDANALTERAVVFGSSRDKEWRSALASLQKYCEPDRWYLCAARMSRAESPDVLASWAGGHVCDSIEDALAKAQARVGPNGRVVVCGSVFVAASARAALLGERCDPLLGL